MGSETGGNMKAFIKKCIKKVLCPNLGKTYEEQGKLNYTGENAQEYIYNLLASGQPAMISRFGAVELSAIIYCLNSKINSELQRKILTILGKNNGGKIGAAFEDVMKQKLTNNAGFFSYSTDNLNSFTNLYLNSIKYIDILGSWLPDEKYVEQFYAKMPVLVRLGDLDLVCPHPWSRVLENKKVLVIHPFEKSIQAQYAKRELLHENPYLLPKFELKTIKAVQSIAGNKTEFATWFDALESMKQQIDKTDFDIALIGCGAYGLPLAAYVKSLGKQAVHLGGALQLMFGIKGRLRKITRLLKAAATGNLPVPSSLHRGSIPRFFRDYSSLFNSMSSKIILR